MVRRLNVVAVGMLLVGAGCLATNTMRSGEAVTHRVGDEHGWRIPESDKPNYFEEWAKGKTFHVGDTLEFDFRSPGANVLEATKSAYEACTQFGFQIKDYHYHGPAVIQLTNPGDYYFISGIGRQCEVGLKLHVNALSSNKTTL